MNIEKWIKRYIIKKGLAESYKKEAVKEFKWKVKIHNKDLITLIDHILEHIKQNNNLIESAVNWEDLRCYEVTYTINSEGEEGYQALIGEADPSAIDLHLAIIQQLQKIGIRKVSIKTEW